MSNNIGQDLIARQLIFQSTSDVIIDKLNRESITFYVGFDLTAPSLHLGHALLLKTINRLVKAGHKALVLLGGFTSKIGDPHGKSESRQILTEETVEAYQKGIAQQIFKLIDNEGSVTVLNNKEWLSKISYEQFLMEYGRYISVNQMIKLETAHERLSKQIHLSLLEFNYMVLQGIDFLYLYEKYNCILQISGSDQWGNMIMGVDLVQKKLKETIFGITLPLLTNSNGKKMGKTEEGALWLDGQMSNPYSMWQYLRNVDDKDVINLLNKLSDLSPEEIQELERKKDVNELKIILADEIVQWIHGKEALHTIRNEVQRQFNDKGPQIFNLEEIKNSPSAQGFQKTIINNLEIEDLMVLTNLVDSKSEAKRKIGENAVKVNGETIYAIKTKVTPAMFLNGVLCLELGKKNRRYLFINE
jgi:tyrosyl-tRNA synthetase